MSPLISGSIFFLRLQDRAFEKSCSKIFFLPAQLAPVNPVLQVQVPVEASQVPWPEQSSGQVRSL